MGPPVTIRWASERHLRIEVVGDAASGTPPGARVSDIASHVAGITHAIRAASIAGVAEVVPAYRTVVVHLDPARAEAAEHLIRLAVDDATPLSPTASRTVEIPVCYDPEFGLDLSAVASEAAMGVDDVVRLHAAAEYRVRFLGFAPGFAYLEGLPLSLHVPRLASPRPRIPAGSVAIASDQAGIYPRETPGGWRILGRTPLRVFDASRAFPSLLREHDRVVFVPISRAEYDAFKDPRG